MIERYYAGGQSKAGLLFLISLLASPGRSLLAAAARPGSAATFPAHDQRDDKQHQKH